jgi:YfiH family protein
MAQMYSGIVHSELLLEAGIVHGTSTKELGNMSFDRSQKGRAPNNFKRFLIELGIDHQDSVILIPNVKHTANLAFVQPNTQKGRIILKPDSPEVKSFSIGLHDLKSFIPNYEQGIDAAISDSPNLYLAVLHADCAPVLIYDQENRQFALIHVGILGTLNGIVTNTIDFMAKHCQADPQKLLAYIGPSICGNCYKPETSSYWPQIKTRLDQEQLKTFEIKWAIFNQLIAAGLTKSHIEMSIFCTSKHHHLFFSNHRAPNRAEEGRNLTIIGLP